MENGKHTNRNGLLVVERTPKGTGTVLIMGKQALTADDIMRRYRGIEGQSWPREELIAAELGGEETLLENGLASLSAYDAIWAYYARVSQRDRCDLLYCSILNGWEEVRVASPPIAFTFWGYDYGYYEGAYNNFSAIFNDVIYGGYAPLQTYATRLNDHLLLPHLDTVHDLDKARQNLINDGAFLEKDEPFVAIAVYGYAE